MDGASKIKMGHVT